MKSSDIRTGHIYAFPWKNKTYFGEALGPATQASYWLRTFTDEITDVMVGIDELIEQYDFQIGQIYDVEVLMYDRPEKYSKVFENVEAAPSMVPKDNYPIGFIIEGINLACSIQSLVSILPRFSEDKCVCDRKDLFNLGCKCGQMDRERAARLDKRS